MCCTTYKSVTLWAGILGIMQSVIGIVMASLDINVLSDYTEPLFYHAIASKSYVTALLNLFLLLQVVWFVSSVALIFRNMSDDVCGIRQWLVTTTIVIIAEFFFPFIVVAIIQLSHSPYRYRDFERFWNEERFVSSYVTLICTFAKGGPITIIGNIVFCVTTGRRIDELLTSSGYVIGQSVPSVSAMVLSQARSPAPQVIYSTSPTPNQMGYSMHRLDQQPDIRDLQQTPNHPDRSQQSDYYPHQARGHLHDRTTSSSIDDPIPRPSYRTWN